MSDDLISRAAAIAACELFDAPVSKSNWVNAQATAAQQIRGAIRALPGTPTPSDTGADSGPGSIPPQPGEAPVSDAPAPTGRSTNSPLPTLEWPDDSPPPSWWGKGPNGELTRVYRSYEDYCDD